MSIISLLASFLLASGLPLLVRLEDAVRALVSMSINITRTTHRY